MLKKNLNAKSVVRLLKELVQNKYSRSLLKCVLANSEKQTAIFRNTGI